MVCLMTLSSFQFNFLHELSHNIPCIGAAKACIGNSYRLFACNTVAISPACITWPGSAWPCGRFLLAQLPVT